MLFLIRMPEPILVTENLSKRYGRRVAVDGLSLEVGRGDIFGFLGQNGAGKSTTIRMTLGLVRPSAGRVLLLGHDMARHPAQALARTGAIVEAPAFYDNFSGRKNLEMFAAMSGGATNFRIDEVLEIVGLSERANDAVRVYSHGMRQRLGIAQALLPEPEFIILDEPTDGLDPQGIREVRLLVRRLRDEFGLTIMLSSHLLNEVEQICNRVAIIDRGKLLYQGTVSELVAHRKVTKIVTDKPAAAYQLLAQNPALSLTQHEDGAIYVTNDNDEQIPRLNALLVAHGFRVSEISPQRETLEQVFLRLTQESQSPRVESQKS